MQKPSTLLVCLFLHASALSAAESETIITWGSIGLTVEDFHYEEENEQGTTLDTEDGTIPGLSLSIGARQDQWFVTGDLDYKENEVDYVGYPSSPNRLTSRTTEKITEARINLGYLQEISPDTRLEYMAGFGIRHWVRDIHSLPDTPGLEETYKWPYFNLAFKPTYQVNPRNSINVILRIKKAFNAKLDVEFKENLYDPVSLDLPEGLGLYLQGTWLHELNQHSFIGIGPYLDLWQFERSDRHELTKNEVPVGYLIEPESLTRSIGLKLSFTRTF